MATDISNITTLQDVINVLSVLFFNLNEVERVFYDIFINPIPMDVPVQRYDDKGILETITVPNRAKMSVAVLTGVGNPNGIVPANVGAFYLDTDPNSLSLYYKSSGTDGTDKVGWVRLWSSSNFQEGTQYVAPNGDGSELNYLNASNINTGILPVSFGGTGTNNITGLIKGNAQNRFSTAVDGEDYWGPRSMAGMIAYYPTANIPTGWLICNGQAVNRDEYSMLYNIIGTIYGEGDGSTTFNVPDLMNHFVRCWDGETAFNTVQQPQVGGHVHELNGDTGTESATHTHTKGNMRISGGGFASPNGTAYPPFFRSGSIKGAPGGTEGDDAQIWFDTNYGGWEGSTSTESVAHTHPIEGTTANNNLNAENRVLNKMLVPIICYGRRTVL